jgi:hypothetical protein
LLPVLTKRQIVLAGLAGYSVTVDVQVSVKKDCLDRKSVNLAVLRVKRVPELRFEQLAFGSEPTVVDVEYEGSQWYPNDRH